MKLLLFKKVPIFLSLMSIHFSFQFIRPFLTPRITHHIHEFCSQQTQPALFFLDQSRIQQVEHSHVRKDSFNAAHFLFYDVDLLDVLSSWERMGPLHRLQGRCCENHYLKWRGEIILKTPTHMWPYDTHVYTHIVLWRSLCNYWGKGHFWYEILPSYIRCHGANFILTCWTVCSNRKTDGSSSSRSALATHPAPCSPAAPLFPSRQPVSDDSSVCHVQVARQTR